MGFASFSSDYICSKTCYDAISTSPSLIFLLFGLSGLALNNIHYLPLPTQGLD